MSPTTQPDRRSKALPSIFPLRPSSYGCLCHVRQRVDESRFFRRGPSSWLLTGTEAVVNVIPERCMPSFVRLVLDKGMRMTRYNYQ
ncbi:hypothetical protein PMIN01_08882 [Paraphaeosphaeria minitans]|uniref:Uncharacterized protein n=1 Tax=Paraphaeosphaeria minitans TaxID=565426 RepID=A0A9P6GD40_9PLEO|nr:hypothetical protein PMIN01_08882 [Paraphaeosphaeria minitans]